MAYEANVSIFPGDLLRVEAEAHRKLLGKPLVTLAYAQSLDGSIAASRGSRLALSSYDSLVLTHRLRAANDAILVGIGTILSDKPRLDVRLVEGKNPQPIILDSHLRFPIEQETMHGRSSSVWVATTEQADRQKQRALEEAGARVLLVPSNREGRVELESLLRLLAGLGVNSLMVEGGARVITSFIAERLVDLLVITVSPVLVGGLHALESLPRPNGGDPGDLADYPKMRQMGYQQLGSDLVIWGRLA